MILGAAIFVALSSQASLLSNPPIIHRVAGNTIGGNGGAGGTAENKLIIECKVAGACSFDPKAVGGNGGTGGAASGGKSPNLSPVMDRDEEPMLHSSITACSFLIGGKTEIDSHNCDFARSNSNTKFAVTAPSTNKKYRYTVTWVKKADGTALGFLQGGKSSEVRALGALYSQGACWVADDSTIKICAWK